MDARQSVESLVSLARPEGGWAYAPDQPPHLEPTCLALLALAPQRERHEILFTSALAFLDRCPTAPLS